MKRFWLILLALGLVTIFSVSALAAEVKFSGSYYAAGMYLDKTGLVDIYADPSTAFYFQRLRVQTDFVVTPALKLVTRFDAMERAWGAPRSDTSGLMMSLLPVYETSADTAAENENIAFDWVYIQYASKIGTFTVGYQSDGAWGTVFGDNAINGAPRGKIGWSLQMGGWTVLAQIVKITELSDTAKMSLGSADRDHNKYVAAALYAWNGGEAGMLYSYERDARFRPYGGVVHMHSLQPYAKAKIGPVAIQTELDYYWGKAKGEDGQVSADLQAINFFLDAVADFNMFYVGGTFAYLSGDDPDTYDKIEDGSWNYPGVGGGYDWNPCLIMFNFERSYWAGPLYGSYPAYNMNPMSNAWFGQIRGGVRPVSDLDIMLSVSYAKADEKYASWLYAPVLNKTYGTEVDLVATYKITNNLSYMLGAGYLFTGDYYKGDEAYTDVEDNFLIINKLTFTF